MNCRSDCDLCRWLNEWDAEEVAEATQPAHLIDGEDT